MPADIELQHIFGYTGKLNSVDITEQYYHYCMGNVIVSTNISDIHDQHFTPTNSNTELSFLRVKGDVVGTASIPDDNNHSKVIFSNLNTGKIIFSIDVQGKVYDLDFSHDGEFVGIAGENSVSVYSMKDGSYGGHCNVDSPSRFIRWQLPDMETFNPRRPTYQFIIAGQKVMKCQWSYQVSLMKFQLLAEEFSLPGRIAGFKREYTCCAVEKDFVYVGTGTGEVIVFNSKNGIYRTSILVCSGGIQCLFLSSETQELLCGGGDGSLKVLTGYDTKWKITKDVLLVSSITAMVKNGDTFLVSISAGKIFELEFETLKPKRFMTQAHTDSVNAVAFSKGTSEYFVSASKDGTIRRWALSGYNQTHSIELQKGSKSAYPICLSYFHANDSEIVISGWTDGWIRCHEFISKEYAEKWSIVNSHRGPVTSIDSCPENNFFISGGKDSVVRIWKLNNQEMIGQFMDHQKEVTTVCIDKKDPSIIHTASLDKQVYSFSLKQSRRIQFHASSSKSENRGFNCMSQLGISFGELITGSIDGCISLWDVDYRDSRLKFKPEDQSEILSCHVSPLTSKYFCHGGESGFLYVYEIIPTDQDVQLNLIATYKDKLSSTGGISSCQFSSDEKQIIVASSDGSIGIWNFYSA